VGESGQSATFPARKNPENEETKEQPTKGGDRFQERCPGEGQLESVECGEVSSDECRGTTEGTETPDLRLQVSGFSPGDAPET